jgi:hypothetical protein
MRLPSASDRSAGPARGQAGGREDGGGGTAQRERVSLRRRLRATTLGERGAAPRNRPTDQPNFRSEFERGRAPKLGLPFTSRVKVRVHVVRGPAVYVSGAAVNFVHIQTHSKNWGCDSAQRSTEPSTAMISGPPVGQLRVDAPHGRQRLVTAVTAPCDDNHATVRRLA